MYMQGYIYITDNNFVHKQKYNYSKIGDGFFEEYKKSRMDAIVTETTESPKAMGVRNTVKNLMLIRAKMFEMEAEEATKELDVYVKKFEVSKHLVKDYDENYKALGDASAPLKAYFLLVECCLLAYRQTGCTKYISCLLKVNDSLISVQQEMNEEEAWWLSCLLKAELMVVEDLEQKYEVK